MLLYTFVYALCKKLTHDAPQTIAMNPEDDEQYIILWKNGIAAYNLGSRGNIDYFDLQEHCTKNFGCTWPEG